MVAVCESAVRHVFQSTLSMRRATAVAMIRSHAGPFQSTLSMRRATEMDALLSLTRLFQSTLSMRRATHGLKIALQPINNFNPRSP